MSYLTEKQQRDLGLFIQTSTKNILVFKDSDDCEDGVFTHYNLASDWLGLDEHDEMGVCIMQPFDSELIQVYAYCINSAIGLASAWGSRVALDFTIYEVIIEAVTYYKSMNLNPISI